MGKPELDHFLELLDVRLEAFAMCEIERSYSLACPPLDTILVHFVLEGEGTLACEHGRYDLHPGRIVLVPKRLAKRLEGPGPILKIVQAGQGCQLSPGLVKFSASGSGAPSLMIGCGSISVGLGGAPGPFDQLDRPLVQSCDDGPLPMLFQAMATELRHPAAGTKAMIEALMKQIVVVILRSEILRDAGDTPIQFRPTNAQLGRAVAAIIDSPGDAHGVESLAALAGMSRSCFNRHFSQSYECSPMEFVQTVRLRSAAHLLAGSDLPVKSIAAAVGYASRSHFSRAFAAEFGVDPSGYRNGRRGASVDADGPRRVRLAEPQLAS